MTILIASSKKDVASLNIKSQILNHYDFDESSENFQENPIYTAEIGGKKVKLVTLNGELVDAQNITNFFKDLELILFISRHSSESGTPTLSVHTPGNLGEAELGGLQRKVSVSPANVMRDTLIGMRQLKDEMQLQYDVCYECTHHGPSLNVPAMFAELGSSLQQWSDLKAAEAVAHAVMKAIAKIGTSKAKAVLGVGGPHYNAKFTRLAFEEDVAFGHIIPKYAISYTDGEIIRQCIGKTLEKIDSAILDWKGIKGEDKPKIVEIFQKLNMPIQKV